MEISDDSKKELLKKVLDAEHLIIECLSINGIDDIVSTQALINVVNQMIISLGLPLDTYIEGMLTSYMGYKKRKEENELRGSDKS